MVQAVGGTDMIRQKPITIETCPFRSFDEEYGHIIPYCPLNPEDRCDEEPGLGELPESCPLFEEVIEE